MKRIINKDSLRCIVNESITNIILESVKDQMNFGIKGPIPLEPAESLCSDVNPSVLAKVDSGNREIPYRKIGDPMYFGGSKIWDAYTKYSSAMLNRADLGRKPVSFFVFLNKIRNGWKGGKLQYFELDGSYLIGTLRQGVFLCIYICPKDTRMSMFRLIKSVCEYNNVVFAITDDMAVMLDRLGCPKYDGPVMAKHMGHDCEKSVYGSTKEAAEKGAKLVNLFYKSSDLGKSVSDVFLQNPKLKALYDKNPNIVYDLMNEPIVTNLLMNNPQLVDFITKNPNVLSQISNDPIRGMLDFLIKYRDSLSAKSTMNERKNIK